jgi:hypothetical protein
MLTGSFTGRFVTHPGIDVADRYQRIAIALVLALATAGCSTSAIDAIPVWAGGEPAGTPQRLATELQYPAVNERPPARDTKVVSEEEQAKIERDLAAAREAQAQQAAQVKKDRAGMLANQPKPNMPSAGAPGN